jgi:hypothetical protein
MAVLLGRICKSPVREISNRAWGVLEILASAPKEVDELAFEVSLRRVDGETEQTALAVVEEAGFKLAVEPDRKVIKPIVFPPGNGVFQCLVEAETDGIPARGSVVEPRAEIGGEEPSEEGFNRIGHGVSFAGGEVCRLLRRSEPEPVSGQGSA